MTPQSQARSEGLPEQPRLFNEACSLIDCDAPATVILWHGVYCSEHAKTLLSPQYALKAPEEEA